MNDCDQRRDATVTPGTTRAEVAVPKPGFRIGTNLWVRWAEIAISSEAEAAKWRASGVQGGVASEAFHDSLVGELKSSLVAVAASAHALDAFYGSILHWSPVAQATREAWKVNDTPRRAQILETIKCGFAVPGGVAKGWAREMKWLFSLRDAAVHFKQEPRDTVPHPGGIETHVAIEHQHYSVESATRAVSLLLDVMQTVRDSGKRSVPESLKWAQDYASLVDALLASRACL